MKHLVLLDANLLIGAFDHDEQNPAHVSSKEKVEELLLDENINIAISPLIRYEVLRGMKRTSIAQMQEILNDFEEFSITELEGNRAAEIYRAAKAQNISLDKRIYDVFHFVIAEVNNLEFDSHDGDIPKIKQIVQNL